MADQGSTPSGLTEKQAQEFHKVFMTSFILFVVVAIIAHILAWQWRPWFPGPEGYGAVTEGIGMLKDSLLSRLA